MMTAELERAVADMADVLADPMTANDVGPRFTCMEAESLAAVLRAAGFESEADAWIEGHASEDEPGDMHHDDSE